MNPELSHATGGWTPTFTLETWNEVPNTPQHTRERDEQEAMLYELCREANGSLTARQLRRRAKGKRTQIDLSRRHDRP